MVHSPHRARGGRRRRDHGRAHRPGAERGGGAGNPEPLLTDEKREAERDSIAAALRRLAEGDHGFGLLVLALALPNAVPGPLIPGFSVPFALGIAALGLQRALGLNAPRLPRLLLHLSI